MSGKPGPDDDRPIAGISTPITLRLPITLLFIGIATGLTAVIIGLATTQIIGLNLEIEALLPPPSPYWHQFVAFSGLLLPIVVRLLKRRANLVSPILNAYLLAMGAQVLTEIALIPHFPRGSSVVLGTLYSTFRLIQLWQGQQWVAKTQTAPLWLRGFLIFLFGIWAINLMRFLLFRWPLMLQ